MKRKSNLEQMLLDFLTRVLKQGRGNSSEVAILPVIVEIYKEFFKDKDVQEKTINPFENEHIENNTDLSGSTNFPLKGYVTAAQVAPLLGYTKDKYKRPEAAVHRLAAEGKIPSPKHIGTRTPRWLAEDIRTYFNSQGGCNNDIV